MSLLGQWVATSSTHVVLDGVPFKITDNFRTSPVVASSEGRLCLRSQSSSLQIQYLFDKEIEYLQRYEDLVSSREAAKDRKRKEAELAAAEVAAAAAAATSAEHGLKDAEPRLAAAKPAAGATAADSDRCSGASGSSQSLALAVTARPATRPTHPGMGHDLLVPKPAVPLKPLLNGGAAGSAAAHAGLPSKAVAPLDLAMFEQEEDVFDKLQLKTLNDFEELRSVLQLHEARPPALCDDITVAESRSSGDGNSSSSCGVPPQLHHAASLARGCVDDGGSCIAGDALDSAGLTAATGASAAVVTVPRVDSDRPRMAIGSSSSPLAAATASAEVGAGCPMPPTAAACADSKTGAAASVHATTAASPAVPAAGAAASPPLESAAARPRLLVHRKVLPSIPPKRLNSTENGGAVPGGAAAATASSATAADASPTAAAATAEGATRAVRLPPPPPPPPKPTLHHAEKPPKPPLPPPPVVPPGKPFSYTTGAGSPTQSPRSGLGSNAWAVKNIVWPDLLSSPEATSSSAVSARVLPSAAAGAPRFSTADPARGGDSGNSDMVKLPAASGPASAVSPGFATVRQDLAANGGASAGDDDLTSKLVAMGFPCRHVDAAVKEFGKDDKKVIEHLCILGDLVDKGYDWKIAQKAILSYPGQLAKVQEYLLSYQRLLEYGFEGQKIQQALMAHDANAEKALDVLAGIASS